MWKLREGLQKPSEFTMAQIDVTMISSILLFIIPYVFPKLWLPFKQYRLGHSDEEWKDRIIYQILTDRFATSEETSEPCTLLKQYCGGTYRGIINHLDYIENLGMNAIWISPIVQNKEGSYHGYHATNFYTLNPHFGSEEDLVELITECHKRDIWVMVDLVFNHVADMDEDFSHIIPFNKEEYYHPICESKDDWGNQTFCEDCRLSNLPDLKQEDSWVTNELINWATWIIEKYKLDGIRVDTVKHVPMFFWKELRQRMPNVYMLGEVFDDRIAYIRGYQEHMSGQLHYPLYFVVKDVFKKQNGRTCHDIETVINNCKEAGLDETTLGGFLDNHDNARFLHGFDDIIAYKNALALTLLHVHIPLVYYGAEQGFNGGDDPLNRESLWNTKFNQNTELYKFIRILTDVRKTIAIKEEHIQRYKTDDVYIYSRGTVLVCTTRIGGGNSLDTLFVAYNPYKKGDKLKNVFTNETQVVTDAGVKVTFSDGQPQVWVKV
ncbi:putative Alpha-amylase [Blattamonas nauphoetae]|uniref:alpha-amylase n=1 Tax=Blattamonas nauphoetae TaxID=2049346 RepID=A0ABQ9YMH5_9EUKA|nr:putative Alpha-amylase [Blattamonas nauphoetae]